MGRSAFSSLVRRLSAFCALLEEHWEIQITRRKGLSPQISDLLAVATKVEMNKYHFRFRIDGNWDR